ncbi:hypothetical protein CLOM621_08742 [Clostridium sp. M62/1]|nr:hypothetical protein CLOM621_08742 [Clostridium sp. M62/1]
MRCRKSRDDRPIKKNKTTACFPSLLLGSRLSFCRSGLVFIL